MCYADVFVVMLNEPTHVLLQRLTLATGVTPFLAVATSLLGYLLALGGNALLVLPDPI